MRALVTGGTGFLGRYIVKRLLARGDEVTVLARPSSDTTRLEEQGVRIIRRDLANLEGADNPAESVDVVYHAGARVVSFGDWEEFDAANVAATRTLIDRAMQAGVRRFVHVSSLGIFEIPKAGVTISEASDYDHEPNLRGYYTRSKIHADRVACEAARSGLPVVVVRPGRIYGYDHPSQPLFMGRVKKRLFGNTWAVVSRPGYFTPIAYVENAADAVVRAGTKEGIEGEILNIVDDSDLTQRAYFAAVDQAQKRHSRGLRVLYFPVGLFLPAVIAASWAFRVLKRRSWSVAYQLRRSGRNAFYSTDAARSVLGWEPQIALDRALEITVNGQE